MKHFGDPCIHCGLPFDDVDVGPCAGDEARVKITAYRVIRHAWQNPGSGCDTVRVFMSDGTSHMESLHPSSHWPYSDRFADAQVQAALIPAGRRVLADKVL